MSYEDFRSALSEALSVEDLLLPPSSSLRDDWDLDSFDLVLLLLWLEDGFAEAVPKVGQPALETMQDAYAYRRALEKVVSRA